jgi:hypothetical protein
LSQQELLEALWLMLIPIERTAHGIMPTGDEYENDSAHYIFLFDINQKIADFFG